VSEAIREFYERPPGCPFRSNTNGSGHLEDRIREGRDSVRKFLNAKFSDEIVFTPNTTFAINLLAGAFLNKPGKVLITDLEHNSNRLPWLRHERIEVPWPNGAPFPLDSYRELLRQNVKLVSITAMSNVTGQAVPVREVVREAQAQGIPVHLDAAQAFASGQLDVVEDLPDFVSFSLHKAYGPMGLGGLYLQRKWQTQLEPQFVGAGAVDDHFEDATKWTNGAGRFEFGLQNYAALYAVPATMAFLTSFDRSALREHFCTLSAALWSRLREIPGVGFAGPVTPECGQHVCSFFIRDRDAARLASLLDMVGKIQVRSGKLCAHHWFHRYGISDVLRVSFGVYNSVRDVEEFSNVLHTILKHYD
jgi:cysteine desulfurase/selenocysteine lyase